MTTSEELAERAQERNRYLIALYDLTKDEQLRWSTHRDVANQAAIPEEQIMTISQRLAAHGLVQLRSMGGIDGYVELTKQGVDAAESLILQGRQNSTPSVDGPAESSPESDRQWAMRYTPALKLAFDAFVRDGDWPNLDLLQRAVDRDGLHLDVRQALRELPRGPGETRPMHPTSFIVPLRIIQHLPETGPLLEACVELVRRAVDIYLSDTDELRLTNEDPKLTLNAREATTAASVRFLLRDYPSPFAGGSYGLDGSWSLSINGNTARRFRDVTSVQEYFQRQDELRRESHAQVAAMARKTSLRRTDRVRRVEEANEAASPEVSIEPFIFVVMPFTETWSAGVYDLIRRAVRSLGYLEYTVLRADEITKPGKIDQQVLQAIANAHVVIGDITSLNPNVMWELGYAEAIGVPGVILNQHIHESPFDLANTRQVLYRLTPTDEDEKNLAAHIKAALEERAIDG